VLLSFDEALATGDARWSVFVGSAEAQRRAITAVEILRGAPPGGLEFVVHGISKNCWAAAIAAAVDPRIKGALLQNGADVGEWSLLGSAALAFNTPTLQSNWELAAELTLAAGYPLHHVLDHSGLAAIPWLPFGEAFSRDLDPARQIALGILQGKRYLVQGATADHIVPLQLRFPWFDDGLARRYPGDALRMDVGVNSDHSSSAPQALKNQRSFPATVFYDRPRAAIALSAESLGGDFVVFTAQVMNPDPSRIEINSVRLHVAYDDDGDFRVYGLPDPGVGAGWCVHPKTGAPQNCFGITGFFVNRNFAGLAMEPTGAPGEYRLALDLSAFGGPQDPAIAVFAEVEDRTLPQAVPSVTGPSRAFASSRIFFFQKQP
jgi:hypothetical protein